MTLAHKGISPIPRDDSRTPRDDSPTPRDDSPTPRDDSPIPRDDSPTPRDDFPNARDAARDEAQGMKRVAIAQNRKKGASQEAWEDSCTPRDDRETR